VFLQVYLTLGLHILTITDNAFFALTNSADGPKTRLSLMSKANSLGRLVSATAVGLVEHAGFLARKRERKNEQDKPRFGKHCGTMISENVGWCHYSSVTFLAVVYSLL